MKTITKNFEIYNGQFISEERTCELTSLSKSERFQVLGYQIERVRNALETAAGGLEISVALKEVENLMAQLSNDTSVFEMRSWINDAMGSARSLRNYDYTKGDLCNLLKKMEDVAEELGKDAENAKADIPATSTGDSKNVGENVSPVLMSPVENLRFSAERAEQLRKELRDASDEKQVHDSIEKINEFFQNDFGVKNHLPNWIGDGVGTCEAVRLHNCVRGKLEEFMDALVKALDTLIEEEEQKARFARFEMFLNELAKNSEEISKLIDLKAIFR